MTEKLKTIVSLNIPVWAFGVIVPILIAFISFTINSNAKANRNDVQIETLIKDVDGKVNKDLRYVIQQLSDIKSSQARIEKKLDQHVENARK
jgi:hypothetical protein